MSRASGTLTFLFSDIEGSTRLIQALADDYPRLLAEHRALIGTAEPIFREGLQLFQKSRDKDGLMLLIDYNLVAQKRADFKRAWQLAGALVKIAHETGIGVLDIGYDALNWRLPDKPTDPAAAAEWEAGEKLSIEDAVALALTSPAGAVAAS